MRWCTLAALAVLFVVSTLDAAGDLFTMDMSSGAQSNAGFSTIAGPETGFAGRCGDAMARTYSATGGPGGGPYYQFQSLYDAAQQNLVPDAWGGECYGGWSTDVGPDPSSGDSRFVRVRAFITSDSNCEAMDSAEPEPGSANHPMRDKLVVLGDGESGRLILGLGCGDVAGEWELYLQNDGGTVGAPVTGLARGAWHNIQARAVLGAGGAMSLWVNNDTLASPNVHGTGITVGVAAYDEVGLGYYFNRAVDPDGVFKLRVADLEYGTTFDSGWNSGGGSPVAGPVRLRLRGDE